MINRERRFNMVDRIKIGNFLRELRNEKNLTQEEIAEKFGVSSRSVSRWENGNTMPELGVLVDLAGFYEVDIKEIIDGERKSENMEKEIVKTLEKVADYAELEKKNEIKRKTRKIYMMSIIAILLFVIVVFSIITVLKSTVEVVEYDDNISVSMVDGNLVGRLQGSMLREMHIKRVNVAIGEEENNYLFFYMANTKWDAITTGTRVFSEDILCYSDKGADSIDAVYYYMGDSFDSILNKSNEDEVKEVINQSVILWKKNGKQ